MKFAKLGTVLMDRMMKSLEGSHPERGRHLLNLVMPRVVPFNHAMGLRIRSLTPASCEVRIPFRRARGALTRWQAWNGRERRSRISMPSGRWKSRRRSTLRRRFTMPPVGKRSRVSTRSGR